MLSLHLASAAAAAACGIWHHNGIVTQQLLASAAHIRGQSTIAA